jgi:TRAP-type C4-dicarboxylate transport system permease small subunit
MRSGDSSKNTTPMLAVDARDGSDKEMMKHIISVVDLAISGAETVLIIGFTAAGMALGVVQVILRYGFNTGLTWAEAVFVILTVAGMMFAGSRAVRDDKHVRVDLITHLFPLRIARFFDYCSLLVSFALAAYFAYCGARYVIFLQSINSVSPATGMPDWIFYALVPVTMGLFAIRYAVRVLRTMRGEDTSRHSVLAELKLEDRV